LYPPLQIQQQYAVPPDKHPGLEEDAQVKSMMLQHGIDHVRGGSYSNVHLTSTQTAMLEKTIRHAESVCFRCGQQNHFANQCDSQTMVGSLSTTKTFHVHGASHNRLVQDQTLRHCERCGRNNHTADRCFATFDVRGVRIATQHHRAVSEPQE
jgi:hypothetical protein